jgi:hypothetical protein
VFSIISEIGVPVVLSSRVALVLEGARQDTDLVLLAPLRGEARLAGLAAIEVALDASRLIAEYRAGSRRRRRRAPARGSRPRW